MCEPSSGFDVALSFFIAMRAVGGLASHPGLATNRRVDEWGTERRAAELVSSYVGQRGV